MTTTTTSAKATLGKLIFRENGHIVVNRVLEVTDNSATIESTYTGTGVVNGTTTVTDIGTVSYTVNNTGQLSGKGQGLIRTTDGAMAAYTENFTGSQDIQGNRNIQGTIHFNSLATEKLAEWGNTTTLLKVQINPSDYFTAQGWQQK
jgi:hypothetical protein